MFKFSTILRDWDATVRSLSDAHDKIMKLEDWDATVRSLSDAHDKIMKLEDASRLQTLALEAMASELARMRESLSVATPEHESSRKATVRTVPFRQFAAAAAAAAASVAGKKVS